MSDNTEPLVDKDELRQLIADAVDVGVEEVGDDTDFVSELEVDSLMALEIVVRVEKQYGVKMQESELKSVTSLDAVAELLSGKLAARA
ncbi:acyl carrier protein [Micromonospora sp. NPDC005203]|uniref:acyl carrier protein n=1 Tax=Micromonospora sp. NPDC005203 TaxID=3364226 RepID=UPI0036BB7856